MLDSVFSCKLYKASNRKDKIRAAVYDPINAELVKQLRSYLDDEYLDPKYLGEDSATVPTSSEPGSDVQDTSTDMPPAGSPTASPSHAPTPSSGNGGFVSNDPDADVDEDMDETDEGGFVNNDPDADGDEVAEAQQIKSHNITASSEVADSLDVESIRGTLNSRQDTSGVSRLSIKTNELWIYYNDSINLNNVMENVIALLNASGFTQLIFNRLARTDNAIVFEVDSVLQPIEPMVGVADASKT